METEEQSTSVAIGTGKRMPILGFGTYLIRNDDCYFPVLQALKAGYRLIDTAEFYDNHEAIGRAVRGSGLAREDIFITDKISPNGFLGMPPRSGQDCLEGIKANLKKLNMDYTDLVLLHHPFPPRSNRIEQWGSLVEAQKQGLVKEIGVSNYSEAHLRQLLEAGLPAPAVNQVELHPLNTLEPLVEYCKSIGCQVVPYSSLAPCSEWRVGDNVRDVSTKRVEESAHNDHLPALKALASKHGVSEAGVLLRWAIEKKYPLIVKSTKLERIESNRKLPFSFSLDKEDMVTLDAMNKDIAFAWPVGNPLLAP